MSRDLVIQVNVNPTTAKGPTETRESSNLVEQTTVERSSENSARNKQSMDFVARQAFNFGLTNIGELTGNATLERRMQSVNQISNLVGVAANSPQLALAMVAVQIGMAGASASIENRNIRIDNEYNRKIKFNTYNNNRRM